MLKTVKSPLDIEMNDSHISGMNHTVSDKFIPKQPTKKGMPSQQTKNEQGVLKTLRIPSYVIDAAMKVVEHRVQAAISAGIPEKQARRAVSERSVLAEFVELGADKTK